MHSLRRSISKLLQTCFNPNAGNRERQRKSCRRVRQCKRSKPFKEHHHDCANSKQSSSKLYDVAPFLLLKKSTDLQMDNSFNQKRKGLTFAEANRKARIVYFIGDDPRLEVRASSNGGFELRRVITNEGQRQEAVTNEDLKRFSTLLQASVPMELSSSFLPSSTMENKEVSLREQSVEMNEHSVIRCRELSVDQLNHLDNNMACLVSPSLKNAPTAMDNSGQLDYEDVFVKNICKDALKDYSLILDS
ncbi:hypothetical protein ACOME3_001894 [Neoechinorhynchus agilis]